MSKSWRVELQTLVCKLFLEQPAAEMEQHFDCDSGMPSVDMSVLHLLKTLTEHVVHEEREIGSADGFGKFIVFFELVDRVAEVDDELMQKTLALFAHFALDVQQKFA